MQTPSATQHSGEYIMEQKYYTNERNHQIVISVLKANGIRKIVASPGTTNISLVGSLQNDPYFEIYSSVDERSAAYLACGLAAESGEAVALSCTGATASRNYFPGLTEAYYRKLPILAITSTQNEYRIGHNFAQVIDRRSHPNDTVRLSVSLPSVKDADDEWYCTVQANKAVLELKHHGSGPVHINLATTYSRDFSVKELPPTRIIDRITLVDRFPELSKGKIGIFVGSHSVWSDELTQAVDNFCASNNAAVFCDHTSGYKGKYRILAQLMGTQRYYFPDIFKLDILIYIGNVTGAGFDVYGKETWRVCEDGELVDKDKNLRYVFEMPEAEFFRHYCKDEIGDDSFLKKCRDEIELVSKELPDVLQKIPFSNIWMASVLAPKLPENSSLHLGILNTLRSWDLFEISSSITSFSNVGGFGIDGNLSSMIGASFVNKDKLYFGIVGDLSFFYDMNVVGNRHVGNNIRIMVVNNGCGTEFKNYNNVGHTFGDGVNAYISATGHFGNKSPNLIKHYAEDLGYEYLSASNKEEFLNTYERFLTPEITDKPILFEVFTDSEDESNALLQSRELYQNVSGHIVNKGAQIAKNVLGNAGYQKAVSVYKKLR